MGILGILPQQLPTGNNPTQFRCTCLRIILHSGWKGGTFAGVFVVNKVEKDSMPFLMD